MLRSLLILLSLIFSLTGHATDFALEDTQGNVHRLSDYRGKWVLVNFWATWCLPCLNEIPELNGLHEAHKEKDLVVIGVAMESGSTKAVADFSREHDIKYPVVVGDRRIAASIGQVEVLPSSYLFSPKGDVVGYQAGELTRASVETYIKNKKY